MLKRPESARRPMGGIKWDEPNLEMNERIKAELNAVSCPLLYSTACLNNLNISPALPLLSLFGGRAVKGFLSFIRFLP